MNLSIKKSVLLILILSSSLLKASDSTLSLNINKGHTKSTVPTKEAKSDTYSGTIVYTKALFPKWRISGILGYSSIDKKTSSNEQIDMDVTTLGLAGSRNLGNGLFLNLAAIYSNIGIDSTDISTSFNNYDADGTSLTSSIGLLKVVPISDKSYATLSAKLTATQSKTKSYTTAGNFFVSSSTTHKTYLSIKAKHVWIIKGYSPNINIQYNIANKEFTQDNDDNDYFRIGTGISKSFGKDLTLSANYSQTVSRNYIDSNKISLSISKKF